MARRSVEDRIAEVAALRGEPDSESACTIIGEALAAKPNVLVAAAADVIRHTLARGHEQALCEAFQRLMHEPTRSDKGCLGKRAIAQTLYELEADAREVFLAGIRHVQLEPVYGGKADTAIELRVSCALGLVRSLYPDVMGELARLLADPEVMARVGAARALAYTDHVDAAAPLLTYVALTRGEDSRVVAAALEGLLELQKADALPLFEELLQRGDAELRAGACIALGESRLAEALPVLVRAADDAVTSEERQPVLLALAMLRSEPATRHLLGLVRDAPEGAARDALEALATFRADASLAQRTVEAALERADPVFERFARDALQD
jgi:HEAT repeat protein